MDDSEGEADAEEDELAAAEEAIIAAAEEEDGDDDGVIEGLVDGGVEEEEVREAVPARPPARLGATALRAARQCASPFELRPVLQALSSCPAAAALPLLTAPPGSFAPSTPPHPTAAG